MYPGGKRGSCLYSVSVCTTVASHLERTVAPGLVGLAAFVLLAVLAPATDPLAIVSGLAFFFSYGHTALEKKETLNQPKRSIKRNI